MEERAGRTSWRPSEEPEVRLGREEALAALGWSRGWRTGTMGAVLREVGRLERSGGRRVG